jgi:hypothetical protein
MYALGYDVELDWPLSRIEKLLIEFVQSLSGKADLDENGQVPLNELPAMVFEHMEVVENDAARFALTRDEVQNGDTVYVNSSEIMYFVIDDTKLDREAGYKPLAAGTAAKAIADKNGNDISQTYQAIISAQNKISSDYVDDSQSTNKFNVQADWSQASNSAPDYIKNKPNITVGNDYIELGNNQRVYFTDTEPTGTIPEGSIGVGW